MTSGLRSTQTGQRDGENGITGILVAFEMLYTEMTTMFRIKKTKSENRIRSIRS